GCPDRPWGLISGRALSAPDDAAERASRARPPDDYSAGSRRAAGSRDAGRGTVVSTRTKSNRRVRLATTATAANPAAIRIAVGAPWPPPATPKTSATSAAPIDWPKRRAVPCIAPAPPLLWRGAPATTARLVGE